MQQDLVAVVVADYFAVDGWLNGLYRTFLQNPDADILRANLCDATYNSAL
jgi:hypothetical protein